MTEPIIDDETKKILAEKSQMITTKAINDLNTLVSSRDDINIFDIFEYVKLINVYGAKIISQGSFKGDKHPNVKTVLSDINIASLALREELEPINPELADDYVWPEQGENKVEE